ncbi:MAG: aminotransferase class I/II-fold pyridoxal phosphate-dependent enzyme [Planctomycetes bacterium]|nr:aminotransferase class I/II-fold pyridoxal phosphate-dependent enzyme [Planctomycetota bacterium]
MGSTKVQIGSHEFLNFSSNDYLGLTGDLRIAEAAASAAGRYGWGTGGSRLVTGSSTLHMKLESEIANFRGTENSLVFGSGYQANLGVLSALAGAGDTIISDAMNHASIIAGCKLSGATVKVFAHRDYTDLERLLNGVKKGKVIVVTDSLFSIEGDIADIPRVVKLCERFGALLVVDDAHANACLGKRGRGIPEMQSVASQVPIVVGTFSKALGSYGGFVACDEELRDFLVNHSRPFIYTTAIPIALAAANLESLKILRKEGEQLRLRLATNTALLRGKLESAGFELTGKYHVLGIRMNSPEEAMFISHEVEFHGILVHPMRWPTVPEGKDCLRISVTAAHSEEDIARLVEALKKARSSTAKKKTDGLTRRQSKRPTHQSLETSAPQQADSFDGDDFGGFGDLDRHPGEQTMSAEDSSRLPPASEVNDFHQSPASAGDTLIMSPGEPGPDTPTKQVAKDEAVAETTPEPTSETIEKATKDASDEKPDQTERSTDTDGASEPVNTDDNEPAEKESAAETQASESSDADTEKGAAAPDNSDTAENVANEVAEDQSEKNSSDGELETPDEAKSDSQPEAKGEKKTKKVEKSSADDEPKTTEQDDESAGDDTGEAPAGSGATLAPESMELADPVIADIEGGTKRRKRKRK